MTNVDMSKNGRFAPTTCAGDTGSRLVDVTSQTTPTIYTTTGSGTCPGSASATLSARVSRTVATPRKFGMTGTATMGSAALLSLMPLHLTIGPRNGLAPLLSVHHRGRNALNEMIKAPSNSSDEGDSERSGDELSSGDSATCFWEDYDIHPSPKKMTLSVAPMQCGHALPDAYRTGTYKFSWNHTKASMVFVVGSFNNWGAGVEMEAVEDGGSHIAYMDLPFGWYHYKFIVDGNWWYDITKSTVKDGVGNVNNVVCI